MNTEQIKRLIESEKRLTSYINELEGHQAELPEGAFKHLTTAENLMMNKRAKLEKNGAK